VQRGFNSLYISISHRNRARLHAQPCRRALVTHSLTHYTLPCRLSDQHKHEAKRHFIPATTSIKVATTFAEAKTEEEAEGKGFEEDRER